MHFKTQSGGFRQGYFAHIFGYLIIHFKKIWPKKRRFSKIHPQFFFLGGEGTRNNHF